MPRPDELDRMIAVDPLLQELHELPHDMTLGTRIIRGVGRAVLYAAKSVGVAFAPMAEAAIAEEINRTQS